ncbi:MAG: 4-alpha-glucanotransferase [Vulcanimicrobiaceae bacterium]
MIDRLARVAGIADSYTDFFGNVKAVSTQTKRAILNAIGYAIENDRDAAEALHQIDVERDSRTLEPVYVVRAGERVELPCFSGTLDPGYYGFALGEQRTTVIAAPGQAYVPPALDRSNAWGFALQLYSLRSDRDWGIGDFGDLARFAKIATNAGAQAIALNPLHQLHLTNPTAASPYSPLSRLHLNALYINIEDASTYLDTPSVTEPPSVILSSSKDARVYRGHALQQLRDTDLIDYAGVATSKLAALHAIYDAFRHLREDDSRAQAFRAFQRDGGVPLRRMAAYEALTAEFAGRDPASYGWLQWPLAFQNPDSQAVAEYAAAHGPQIEFYEFAQWLADMQLAAAADAASGMSVGLYRDLAIGVDSNSVDVWADRTAFCQGIAVGAPPDALNTAGQNWGLPPLNPRALRERAYAPFINVVRANMRHAGALRIDHVMGLMRLFCIPQGAAPSDGAYVNYPFEDLLGILALESHRNRCMIVGEDLGTVPPGFRERLAAARIFSCRLLYFERDENGAFRDPSEYPPDAVASTGTHDLSPLAGYWQALPPQGRAELLQLFDDASPDASDLEIVAATYRSLGRTRARLLLLQMEDALLQRAPVNVPGTTTEAPNWRRKLPARLEALQEDARFATIVAALRESRSGTRR